MFDFQPVGNLWFLSRLYFGFLLNTLKYDKKDKNKLAYIFLLDLVRYLRLISLFSSNIFCEVISLFVFNEIGWLYRVCYGGFHGYRVLSVIIETSC